MNSLNPIRSSFASSLGSAEEEGSGIIIIIMIKHPKQRQAGC